MTSSFDERELRQALEPLAGDPVTDAARVLDALPPPAPPGLPPITWWLLAGGLLAGLAIGALVGSAGGARPAASPDPTADPPSPSPAKPYQELPPIRYSGFGDVNVAEPGTAAQPMPGMWQLEMGAVIDTGTWGMAGLLLPEDVIVRLRHGTRATIAAANRAQLERGTLFLAPSTMSGPVTVGTDLGDVEIAQGAALVARDGDALTVLALKGAAIARPAENDDFRVGAGQRLRIARNGEVTGPEPAGFLGEQVEWMNYLLRLQMDDTELKDRISYLVTAYAEGTHRDEAAHQILRLGGDCAPRLVELLQSDPPRPSRFRRALAQLLADSLDFRTAHFALPLLASEPDRLVRARLHAGIARVTGDADRGEPFYRDASPAERQAAAESWMQRLYRPRWPR